MATANLKATIVPQIRVRLRPIAEPDVATIVEMPAVPRVGESVGLQGLEEGSEDWYVVRTVLWSTNISKDFDVDLILWRTEDRA